MKTIDRSYWAADTAAELLELTVGTLLQRTTERAPDQVALIEGCAGPRRRWTYDELLTDSKQVARSLLERFEPGERIAIWAPNVPEWLLLEFGAALAGLVIVTVNPAFREQELAYVLDQSGASGIFLTAEHRGSPMLSTLQKVASDLAHLRDIVVLDTDWEEFRASGTSERALPLVDPESVAQIQYTSGTTGFAKGVQLRHMALVNNARFFAERLGVGRSDVFVNPMPMFHTAGCVLNTLGTTFFEATNLPVVQFDPALVLELMQVEGGTVLGAVPTMLIAMMEQVDQGSSAPETLRVVLTGGAPVPEELVRRVEATLEASVAIVFGQTECSPAITLTRLEDTPTDKATTVGQPLPHAEVKVADPETGEPVALGVIGELCTRGYHVMVGYNDMPEATTDTIDDEQWLHTGDLGSMDERGFCKVTGRLRDMILRGGENIYPREIEDVLLGHPSVFDAAVIGIQDEHWGEVVAACLRLRHGAAVPTHEELRAHVRARLANHKTPVRWFFVDDFPMTASGKIQKFVLRDRVLAGTM